MKKINNTLFCCCTISKYKALTNARQLAFLQYITIVTGALLCFTAQHEELQIMYANLRV